jgi:uncharacterized membrane protein
VTAVATSIRVPDRVDRRLRIAIAVLSVIGIGVASYLTYIHYAGLKVVCFSGGGGCEAVQSSRWAKLDGVPVSVLGLIGYVGILGSLAVRGEIGRIASFGLALVGFLFSMYLTYREAFSIHNWCQWCLSSAALMTALVILTGIRALRDSGDAGAQDPAPRPHRRRREFSRAERRRRERARSRR